MATDRARVALRLSREAAGKAWQACTLALVCLLFAGGTLWIDSWSALRAWVAERCGR